MTPAPHRYVHVCIHKYKEYDNLYMCYVVALILYWRMQNNCSPSDRFIPVQCRIFAPSVLFFNVYYKQ